MRLLGREVGVCASVRLCGRMCLIGSSSLRWSRQSRRREGKKRKREGREKRHVYRKGQERGGGLSMPTQQTNECLMGSK
jgi:hypothetical protein